MSAKALDALLLLIVIGLTMFAAVAFYQASLNPVEWTPGGRLTMSVVLVFGAMSLIDRLEG